MPVPGIAIVGGGAVGTMLAGSLICNGQRVHLVECSAERRKQLALLDIFVGDSRLDADPELLTVGPDINTLPGELEACLVAVKSYGVEDVVASLSPLTENILVVANGLMMGTYNLGLLYGGASVSPSGETRVMDDNLLVAGALPGAPPLPFPVEDMLGTPWLQVKPEPDIRVRMFHKLALNCVINPLTAITDRNNGELPLEETANLMRQILAEISLVAGQILGIAWQYDADSLMSDCLELINRTAGNSSSMREDLRRGRRTEISMMNQAVTRLATGLGLDCPCNTYMGNMICLLANRQAL